MNQSLIQDILSIIIQFVFPFRFGKKVKSDKYVLPPGRFLIHRPKVINFTSCHLRPHFQLFRSCCCLNHLAAKKQRIPQTSRESCDAGAALTGESRQLTSAIESTRKTNARITLCVQSGPTSSSPSSAFLQAIRALRAQCVGLHSPSHTISEGSLPVSCHF